MAHRCLHNRGNSLGSPSLWWAASSYFLTSFFSLPCRPPRPFEIGCSGLPGIVFLQDRQKFVPCWQWSLRDAENELLFGFSPNHLFRKCHFSGTHLSEGLSSSGEEGVLASYSLLGRKAFALVEEIVAERTRICKFLSIEKNYCGRSRSRCYTAACRLETSNLHHSCQAHCSCYPRSVVVSLVFIPFLVDYYRQLRYSHWKSTHSI